MEDLEQIITNWIQAYITEEILPEAVILLLVLFLGFLFGTALRYILKRIRNQLAAGNTLTYAPWLEKVFIVGQKVARPFSIWVLGRLAISLFEKFNWNASILEYIVPFFGLYLLYRLCASLIELWLKPEQISLWRDQILRPTIIVFTVLQMVGLLDGILEYEITFTQELAVTLSQLLTGLVVLYIFVLLGRWVRGLLRDVILPRLDADPSIIPIVATFSSYLVITIGLFVGLTFAGVDLTAVAVVLGGLSVGIGFGLQELINNFISGFILLFERSLIPGDIVETSDASGVVKDVRLRTTHIQSFDNLELIVPNGQLLSGTLINYSQKEGSSRKRIHITIGTSYQDDPHRVMAALLDTAKGHPGVLVRPEPQVFLMDFGDSSINYELRVWVANAKMMVSVGSTLRLSIWDMFAREQFTIPFPQRDVHLITADSKPKPEIKPDAPDSDEMKPVLSEPPEGLDDIDDVE